MNALTNAPMFKKKEAQAYRELKGLKKSTDEISAVSLIQDLKKTLDHPTNTSLNQ